MCPLLKFYGETINTFAVTCQYFCNGANVIANCPVIFTSPRNVQSDLFFVTEKIGLNILGYIKLKYQLYYSQTK
jgi:hypothetical protein